MASKRRIRRKACQGKVRHRTAAFAEIARRKLREPGVGVYRCRFCGLFHIGHRPARVRQAIAARLAARR